MTEPEEADPAGDKPALTQQERAIATMRTIAAGGDLTVETFRLANDFTDRQTAKLSAWFGRWKPKR
jgi:hypothetical protein